MSEDQLDKREGKAFITGSGFRHLAKSLRVRKNEELALSDGGGTLMRALVENIKEGRIELRIMEEIAVGREKPTVSLIQGLSRPAAMDEAISRAAEAGICNVIPILTSRSEPVVTDKFEKRLERWRRIAVEASMVARRPWKLEVGKLVTIEEAAYLGSRDLSILFWEEEREFGLNDILPPVVPEKVNVLIGPEGGLGMEDVDNLLSAGWKSASLGYLMLRSCSAGSYAAMLIRYHYGLLGGEKRRGND